MASAFFTTSHFSPPTRPVILSVPHAGRVHDPALLALLRVPVASVLPLEDRHADRLIDSAVAGGAPAIVALTPRLAIDLNRAPDDLDPASTYGGHRDGRPASARVRAGLGLIPMRLAGVGDLWRGPFEAQTIEARVRDIHAPYHHAIAQALDTARLRWGIALLIDIHSMPPIKGDDAPDIVVGDRFGSSASAQLTATTESVLSGLGLRVAVNAPYAGGYIVARHAQPGRNIYALQIEVDRRMYLDAAFDEVVPGLARTQRAIGLLVDALSDELLASRAAAAE